MVVHPARGGFFGGGRLCPVQVRGFFFCWVSIFFRGFSRALVCSPNEESPGPLGSFELQGREAPATGPSHKACTKGPSCPRSTGPPSPPFRPQNPSFGEHNLGALFSHAGGNRARAARYPRGWQWATGTSARASPKVTSTVARATDPSVRARDRRRRARARFHADVLDCALAGGCARDPRAAEDRSLFLVLGEVLFCSDIILLFYFLFL